jgi:hypothetical protein
MAGDGSRLCGFVVTVCMAQALFLACEERADLAPESRIQSQRSSGVETIEHVKMNCNSRKVLVGGIGN